MKLTAILVSFLLFSNAIAAGLPFKPQTDTVVIGKDASTDNKEIIFNTGDGAGNPKIEVDNTTKEINANTSLRVFEKLRLGNNSAYVKWDSSLERLVYSNNGVLEKKIGSGSGSGDEGINILENPSFEDGELGWVPNDGTIDILDFANPTEDDGKYLKFISTADNGYFESAARAIPSFVTGSCSANIFYKTTENNNFTLKVLMGVSVLAVLDLPASNWERKAISFPCPDEGEPVKLRIISSLSGKEFLANKAGLGSDFRVREAFDASPVGTIVASILDEAQFSAQNGTGWILADGRNVSGSNYAVVKGENNVPDLRGVFLRGKDNGAGKDIERDLGNYQEDAFQGHWHTNGLQAIGTSGGGTWVIGNGTGLTNNTIVRNPYTDGVNGTPRTAKETRPKNVAVNYFIKINGKSVQTISDVGYALRAGQIITGAFQTCPVNTLEANGAEYDGLKFPHLFAAIGTTHGTGSTANHGRLPDYRGRFLRGHDSSYKSLTFTSSVIATNNLPLAGHGIKTGDLVRITTGAVTGLTLNTDYYAIANDENSLSFAANRDNAFAGTKITISGTVTGTLVSGNDLDSPSRDFINLGGSQGNLVGTLQSDAIRNITGTMSTSAPNSGPNWTGTGALVPNGTSSSVNGTSSGSLVSAPRYRFNFDASLSVPTGSDNRPKNVAVKYCIQTVNTDITGTFRQVDELEKRLRDSGSILVKRENTANGWYEIYSDGWVEQYQTLETATVNADASTALNYSFAVSMRDTNYSTRKEMESSGVRLITMGTSSKTTSSASVSIKNITAIAESNPNTVSLRVEGYGASSVLATHGVYVDY